MNTHIYIYIYIYIYTGGGYEDDEDDFQEKEKVVPVAHTPLAVLARPQHAIDKQEELKRKRSDERTSSGKFICIYIMLIRLLN
jgi:hypothetical protein